MNRVPLIIDCDPGTDDIAALMLAKNMSRFDIKAVTTVSGNVPLEYTTRNALRLLSFLNWDIPVGSGAAKPLTRKAVTAEDIHGKTGMAGLELPETAKAADDRPAWDLIYDMAEQYPGELEIVAIGPLTNIAIALAKYPELVKLVRRIVIMGGGILAGNTTPAAEFNILVDPEAAKRVFTSGIPFWLCPLDVTHEAFVTPKDLEDIRALGSEQARFFAEITSRALELNKVYTKGRGVALHDPLAMLFAEDESLCGFDECFIGVETKDGLTLGKTVTDCYSDVQLKPNGRLVQTVERTRFVARIIELMGMYPLR
jgi:inosine-uridine nucleoside N-ribohydrolase